MNDPNFDKLLDGILHEDAQVEPISGLEDRILARLATTPQRRFHWRLVAWGIGGAVPACLALAFALTHHPVPKAGSPVMASHEPPPAQRPAAQSNPTTRVAIAQHNPKPSPIAPITNPTPQLAETLPKLDVFPTPTEAEEPVRELAALSVDRHTPFAATDQPGKLPAKIVVEPIIIAAIDIKPLFPVPVEPKKSQDPKETK